MRIPRGFKNLETNGGGGSAPAQMQPQQMGVNAMGMAVYPTTTDTSGSDHKVQTQRWEGAAEEQRQAFDRERAAAEQQAQGEIKLAEQQAPAYQAEQLRAAAEREQHIVRMANIQRDIEARTKLHDARVSAAMENPGGFWDNKTDEDRSRIRMGLWLSAIGGGIAREDSAAMSALEKAIDRDAKAKQQRAERLYKQADIAKGYLADAYKARADELSDYNANVEAGWRAVAKDADVYAKTMLPQQLRAQADQKIAQIGQKAAEANMRAQQELAVNVHEQHSEVQPTNMNQQGGATKEAGQTATAAQLKRLNDEFRAMKPPSDEAFKQRQHNLAAMERTEKAEKESGIGQTAIGLAREFAPEYGKKAFPHAEYEGLSQQDQRYFQLAGEINRLTETVRNPRQANPETLAKTAKNNIPSGADTAANRLKKHKTIVAGADDIYAEFSGRAGMNKIEAAQAPTSMARPALAPARPGTVKPIPQLIAEGKAAKAAGNMAEAQRIHKEVSDRISRGEQ